MYEENCFSVKIIEGPKEGTDSCPPDAGLIQISCRDDRLLATGDIPADLRMGFHSRLSPWDVEDFIERITAEYYAAGQRVGKKEALTEIKKIKSSFDKLLNEVIPGEKS